MIRPGKKLTDEAVLDLLTSGEPAAALAAKYKVSLSVIWAIRGRRSKRALRIAQRHGLLPAIDSFTGWNSSGDLSTGTARRVRA